MRSQDMPADHAAAYAFVLRRANILYACGKSVSVECLECTRPPCSAGAASLGLLGCPAGCGSWTSLQAFP